MIVTLTLNPSVDRTVEVEALVRGDVMRALASGSIPAARGSTSPERWRPTACRPGPSSRSAEPRASTWSPCCATRGSRSSRSDPGAIRSNITVVEPDGTTTKFNEPGAELSADELAAVFAAVKAAADSADWLVASGSLPPGTPADVYADLVRGLAGSGTCVAVDTSGPALEAVLAAGPTLVKPNRDELAEVTGLRLETIADVVEAATRLRDRGAGAVLASLGADGAVLVDEDGAIHGRTPAVPPRSSVGAGDAMLAGFLAGGGKGAEALVEGLAWGAAAVLQPGSGMPSPADIDRVAVRLERQGIQRRDALAMPP